MVSITATHVGPCNVKTAVGIMLVSGSVCVPIKLYLHQERAGRIQLAPLECWGEGNGNPLQFLAWRILWTEEPHGLQAMGVRESDTTEQLNLPPYLRVLDHW